VHELHLHSCYSFRDGASQPHELVERAVALGYRALALTDHDGLHGAMTFALACRDAGIQPITGVELTLRHGLIDRDSGPVHLTLLAETDRGYANLCRLVTHAHQSSPKLVDRAPGESVALDPAELARYADGLIVLSGCRQGEASRLVDAGRLEDAGAALERLAALFGSESTFVELQHNLVQGDTGRVRRLVELAERLGLAYVATGDVHYHAPERCRLHDALTAVRHRSTLEASHRVRRPNHQFYLRPPDEVRALFAEHPRAIAAAAAIAERCQQFVLHEPGRLGYVFPDFARRSEELQASADQVLDAYCWQRFEQRYPPGATEAGLRARAHDQLEAELALIARHGLSGFFLIYRDLQAMATRVAQEVRGAGTIRGGSGLPPGRGRGSSVSSIVCYLIGLSHVDPVKTKLFFRRFLNEDLQTVPDIDVDFARDIRERLILAVYDHYGRDNAALVCTFATYHLRSAVRDLGKVLGLPPAAIDKLAKLSEGGGADTVSREIDRLPEFQGQADGPLWHHLVELAADLDGFPRHVGQHVGGMIISSKPVVELVPVQPAAMAGRYICQWDKDSCDDARFIKIDFLALGMLSLVEECLEHVWQNRGMKLDLSTIAYDDAAVYDQICRGDTVGMFQIESRAQIQMLTRTQPRTLDELAVQVAIVRPGPIVGGAVNPYVRRREQLRRDPSFRPRADHPLLDELLADTLGVVLYQDQVLEVAMKMGRFTAGQADQFRRAMSRRRSAEAMEKFRQSFVAGAVGNQVAEADAQAMFDKLRGFSEFGFPKSHAYAFAILAYQSAWLRHYYPAEFYAALLNNQPMGFYPPHVLVGDARRHGLQVLAPAINASQARTIPRDEQLLLGLGCVRGIGDDAARAIVAERQARGPFRSLRDLLQRTGLTRPAAENLIAVGALGDLGLARRDLIWQLGLLLPSAPRAGQLALPLPIEQDMAQLPDMTTWEKMIADYGLLELSPSYHPLGLLRRGLPDDALSATQLRRLPSGRRARTVGLVVCRQRPGTAKGYVFLLIEDETGLTNVVIKPALYEAERSVVRGEPYLCVEGIVRQESGSFNLIAERVSSMADLPGLALPHPRLQHPYPGNPYDAREVAGAGAAALDPSAALEEVEELLLATPGAHNFH
jgi:error-prone DNA polymerase